MSPVTYRGERPEEGPVRITKQVDDQDPKPLAMRNDIRNHSPDGGEWGYGGSGPAQLSIALLSDVLGDYDAERLYMRFKFDVVAGFPREGLAITASAIEQWASEIESKEQP